MQFGLAQTPLKAYFLKREERVWLDNRQKREAQIRAAANPHTSSMIGEWSKRLLFHGMQQGHSTWPITSNQCLTHNCAHLNWTDLATTPCDATVMCMTVRAWHLGQSMCNRQ